MTNLENKSVSSNRKKSTFAPSSEYDNILDIISPKRGNSIEVVIAWHERVLNTFYFENQKAITIGTDKNCDVILPPVLDAPRKMSQLTQFPQGDVIHHRFSNGVQVILRQVITQVKPPIIPFFDLNSNGALAVLLAIIVSSIVSLYVALKSAMTKESLEPKEDRLAVFVIESPLAKPPKKISRTTVKPRKIKRAKPQKIKKPKGPQKRTQAKKPPGMSSPGRKGRLPKTSTKPAAQTASERVEKSGIFATFGTNGKNQEIDKNYSGEGELTGLAKNASGNAGGHENLPGSGIGNRLKDTGKSGLGQGNQGVSGLGNGRKGSGFGNSIGLGEKSSVAVHPGGHGEEFFGSIDKEGIRKVFFDNSKVIRSCYERELNKHSRLRGKIILDFDIGEQGRVVGRPKVNWGQSTLKNKSVGQCILTRLKMWRFPEPPSRQVVRVLYPIAFAGAK